MNFKLSANQLSSAAMESELLINVDISKELEKAPGSEDNDGEQDSMCRINIEVSSYTPLTNVEVNVEVCRPLMVADSYHVFPTLRE